MRLFPIFSLPRSPPTAALPSSARSKSDGVAALIAKVKAAEAKEV